VDATMNLIQIIIDYALGILAFIALIYLIYHGFLMLTASGDEKQFDKGKG
jgi:threonine/homoserine/homoserine lactone efflux protein